MVGSYKLALGASFVSVFRLDFNDTVRIVDWMKEERLGIEQSLATNLDAIDWSNLVMQNNASLTYSFLERENFSIEFENRDALLEALCQRVFGAKPIFKQ
jgi:hypothetical protein